MKPEAKEKYDAAWDGETGILSEVPPTACLSFGTPRMYFARSPFEIFQVPGRVIMIFEAYRQARIIYTDGRGHLEGAPASFMGHSIGKWDGDTLVVDTVGINSTSSWIDRAGTPHSDALHVVERFRRLDHGTLEVEFLFDDPKAYTKPWGGKKVYKLGEGWEILEHVVCEELLLEKRGFREESR